MLTMTLDAAAAIRALADQQNAPDDAGLRIANSEAGMFTANLVDGPDVGDDLIEDGGARLFVAPEAAQLLGDLTLDANVDPAGSVTFAFREA